MNITQGETGSDGFYKAQLDGHHGELTYSRTSPRLIINDHIPVDDALRGQGAGQALAEFAVAQARTKGWKIIPLCPFFKAQVERHPDWQDIIHR
ncbi:GNAT family N-acetyltransferase [Rhizobium lemnae]|uniref:GNAT family N-acetyltransferase n=1 Tax=Rhizobium lemnae TaxID=1214924 RepID=A0ABV8E354_9HYPH|nr:GNAT family N-acetyltransferase [Rhizobium lemnae]MCJ8509189.1 GNAT family N-acetyltransferase [Rhizobium lemnae]